MLRESAEPQSQSQSQTQPRAPEHPRAAQADGGLPLHTGNAAVARAVARRSAQRTLARAVTFSRFEGAWALVNWWYNDEERTLMALEASVAALVNELSPLAPREKSVRDARDALAEVQAAPLAAASYPKHTTALTRARTALERARDRIWLGKGDTFRGQIASIGSNPATAYPLPAGNVLETTAAGMLGHVGGAVRQQRADELRSRIPDAGLFGPDVVEAASVAIAPYDDRWVAARSALLAVHPAATATADRAIHRAGGAAQAHKLAPLLARVAGDWTRLDRMLAASRGSAAAFDRLHTAALTFMNSRPPATPAPALPPRPQPPSAIPNGFVAGAFMKHFLERHTYEWFDFAGIDRDQGFWPLGTDAAAVCGYVEQALTTLFPVPNAGHANAHPGNHEETLTIGAFTVQIGFSGPAAARRVGQFFPVSGPGIVTLTKTEMQAIEAVVV